MKSETIVGLFVITAIGIFFYLSFTIGSLRFDRAKYDEFSAYFTDITGLEIKDPVRIAGVTVGSVKEIHLAGDRARVIFYVQNQYRLACNASAAIRQQGLLGNNHLEIDPGDSATGYLAPGSTLKMPTGSTPSVSELMNRFGDIAQSVKTVASSLETSVASRESQENITKALSGFAQASDRMAHFSQVLERTLERNEETINKALDDIRSVSGTLREGAPRVIDGFTGVTTDLTGSVFPSVTDAGRGLSNACDSFQGLAGDAREGFKSAGIMFDRINSGKGLVGRLINEEEMYKDFRKTMKGIKDYVSKIDSIEVLLDMHSETMLRNWNSKGYFELRLRPTNDYFYQFQLVTDERGTVDRLVSYEKRFDCNGNLLSAPNAESLYKHPDRLEVEVQHRNDVLFGFQFGKRFDRLAFRAGLFESTFGLAVDYYVPIPTDKVHWVSTLELFDIKGYNRVDNDRRPHLKWINRMYFMKNMYTAFGVDDFISKNNANPFFGGGIRFNDNDLKYLLSFLPIGVLANGVRGRTVVAVD